MPALVVVVAVMAGDWKDGTRASLGQWITEDNGTSKGVGERKRKRNGRQT